MLTPPHRWFALNRNRQNRIMLATSRTHLKRPRTKLAPPHAWFAPNVNRRTRTAGVNLQNRIRGTSRTHCVAKSTREMKDVVASWVPMERDVAHGEISSFTHIVPFARGGEATLDNICLMCRTHNALVAERDYGAHSSNDASLIVLVRRHVCDCKSDAELAPAPNGARKPRPWLREHR
jgi:hypothetical protein